MAEASIQFLLDNLKSLLQEEVGLIMGVDQEMNKLSSTLTAVQAVLEDAEQKQLESKSIRDWLCKINDLTYEIDDILDECATEISILELKNSRSSRYGLKNILFRRKIGRRMKQVSEKLDMIAAERDKFHLREMGLESRKSNYAASRERGPVLNESEQIYGRDEEREQIVDILVKGDRDEQLSVLPIIGIGGLGKTTLAQLVFNDKQVDEHFHMKIWVCVSDNFDEKTLIKAMIESATGEGSCSDLTHLDALQRRLRELLNQKRYLIVLDDVWNDDQEKWGLLRNAVACGSKGATIVVTTRLKIVADIMGTLPAHHIAGLSDKNCWLLFKERAFGQEKEERVNLVGIGRQIVEKCCGVPLAAKALGGLLRFKRTEKEWLHVLNSEIWNLPQDTLLLPALQLSYHHLPLELRRCFAYCAVFPKDTEIDKDELIFRWMGHGYISSYGRLEEEDIGNAIWNELVLRSLFQDVKDKEDLYGIERTTCTMHDLVHDLAQSVMENKVPEIQAQLNDKAASKDFRIREVNLRKHRVAFPCRIQPDIDLSFSLTKLNRLRALDASHTRIDSIPSTIGNLKHLRYLNLALTDIRTLPDAICSLWNLKILNLNSCRYLVGLPKQMRILRNLRHLLLEGISLDEMPPKMGELSSLKTLRLFVVGVGKGNGLGELQFLNIGGKLSIRHLERVKNHMDASMADLHQKKNLRELSLEWEDDKTSENMDEDVLKALEPHPNIKIIRINGFRGSYFPRWLGMMNLVEFYLGGCANCCSLARLGELSHLKIMVLTSVGVEYIVDEDEISSTRTKFPSLEQLELNYLEHLKGVSKGNDIESFPLLRKLCIWECPNCCSLARLGELPHLKTMELWRVGVEYIVDEDEVSSTRTKFPSLEQLGLFSLKHLKGFSKGNDIESFPRLQKLQIRECFSLMISQEDVRYLKSLRELDLSGLPMVSLPEALKHLSSPYSLKLYNLLGLTTIDACLTSSTSLISLEIIDCLKLTSLPDSIKETKNLRSLVIRSCRELEKLCEKEKGQDWHKIAHIPDVTIG